MIPGGAFSLSILKTGGALLFIFFVPFVYSRPPPMSLARLPVLSIGFLSGLRSPFILPFSPSNALCFSIVSFVVTWQFWLALVNSVYEYSVNRGA